MRKTWLLLSTTALAVALVAPTAASATATSTPRHLCAYTCQQTVYDKVMHSADPHKTWSKLTKTGKVDFGKASTYKHVRVAKHKVTKVTPPPGVARHGHWTCRKADDWLDWNNIFGGTTMATWVTAEWCWSNELTITYNKMIAKGGETSTPGWTYLGITATNTNGTGGILADQAADAHFGYGFTSSINLISQDNCTQATGDVFGNSWVFRTCKLQQS